MRERFAFSLLLGCLLSGWAAGGQTTYRDALGRRQGSATTDKYGKTTYRDALGRIQATSMTDRHGQTTYRDAQGRIIGTKKE